MLGDFFVISTLLWVFRKLQFLIAHWKLLTVIVGMAFDVNHFHDSCVPLKPSVLA